jgi:hypothetical protein
MLHLHLRPTAAEIALVETEGHAVDVREAVAGRAVAADVAVVAMVAVVDTGAAMVDMAVAAGVTRIEVP